MPDLDWPAFTRRPGTADRNFEHLTYDVVRRNFGPAGALVYPSNAVGVEFTLELTQDCALGRAGETIAWQCKCGTTQGHRRVVLLDLETFLPTELAG